MQTRYLSRGGMTTKARVGEGPDRIPSTADERLPVLRATWPALHALPSEGRPFSRRADSVLERGHVLRTEARVP